MKKLLAIIITVMILCTMAVVASAEIVAPEGFEVTFVSDFSDYEGNSTAGESFWIPAPEDDCDIYFEDGKVTFAHQGMWGAFYNFSDDQTNLFYNKTGWGFYVKNGEYDTCICAGFNGNDGKNYCLDEAKTIMFVDMEGNVTYDETFWGSSGQGAILVPYEFEGYIYIPFSAYFQNPDGNEYDSANVAVLTPIYALSEGEEFTYGEIFTFSTDKEIEKPDDVEEPTTTPDTIPDSTDGSTTPTDVPTTGATDGTEPAPANNGWILWVAIAAAVVVVAVVVVIIVSKKKKAE